MMPLVSRRQFIKAGLAGSLLLAFAGHAQQARAADDGTGAMLAAVAGVILEGMLPEHPARRRAVLSETVAGIDQAVAGLALNTRKEVGELFSLLTIAPVRRLLAGVSAPWAEAQPAEIAAFLERWRYSRFALLQSAYAALHDLVLGAWYARSENWGNIGYPGAPEVY